MLKPHENPEDKTPTLKEPLEVEKNKTIIIKNIIKGVKMGIMILLLTQSSKAYTQEQNHLPEYDEDKIYSCYFYGDNFREQLKNKIEEINPAIKIKDLQFQTATNTTQECILSIELTSNQNLSNKSTDLKIINLGNNNYLLQSSGTDAEEAAINLIRAIKNTSNNPRKPEKKITPQKNPNSLIPNNIHKLTDEKSKNFA